MTAIGFAVFWILSALTLLTDAFSLTWPEWAEELAGALVLICLAMMFCGITEWLWRVFP